jgi:uncharacterized protein (UPF0276 family)
MRNYQIICHGISLSLGSKDGININFLKEIKKFLDKYQIKYYSEHISFSSMQNKQSYELLPLPLTKKVVEKVVENIDIVQNYLNRNIALENATYYYIPESEMSEIDFLNSVIKKSGCKLLLDINNVFVNGHNHKYDTYDFIDKMPLNEIAYYHIAGHEEYDNSLLIDTHGDEIKKDVFDLLEYTLKKKKAPVLLERDNNIPPLNTLLKEYEELNRLYANV